MTLSLFMVALTTALAQAAPIDCAMPAVDFARLVAARQHPKSAKEIHGPFTLKEPAKNVTDGFFAGQGADKAKIEQIKNGADGFEPTVVFSVALLSADKWDCLYYVTFKRRASEACSFSQLTADHCAK